MKTKFSSFMFLIVGALTCHFSSIGAEETYLGMPLQFFVKQHWFSWTNTFDIESKENKYGVVHRKLFSWTPEYHFYDLQEQVQAKARMSFFSFGAIFDIVDAFELPLGRVEERIFTFFSTFDIFRPDGFHAAKAKLNFWGTKYTVTDTQTNEVIAYLWRNFFRLKDDWTVDIVKPELIFENKIDPRLFVLVMAFQTDRDYWKKLKREMDQALNGPSVAMYDDLEYQRSILESYRDTFGHIVPTKEDIVSMETIIDQHLNAVAFEEKMEQDSPTARIKALDYGMTVLLPLFQSDELSLGQKSALFSMMDHVLMGLTP